MVDVVFEAAVSKDTWGVRENARTFRHLRKHSVVTAHVTRILCRHARIDTDHAFLTGLLHDLGMFALLQAAPQVAREQLASEDALWPEIDALHEGLSSTLAARLLLPDELTQDIANHHSLTNNTSRTSAAVSLADHLSQRLGANLPGFGRSALDCMTQDNVDIACSILALDDIHLNRVCIEAERVIAQITTL
jgi:HD-like signal output (HDOD) protein